MHKMIIWLIKLVVCILNVLLIPILLVGCFVVRFHSAVYDVGLGPEPLINNVYWKRALQKVGFKAETFVLQTYYLTNDFDFDFSQRKYIFYRLFFVFLFLKIVWRYKIIYIYFNGGLFFGYPLFNRLEPYLYKVAKRKIVVMPYGSDSQIFERTPNKLTVHYLCQDYPVFFRKNHKRISSNVERWSRYADVVVGATDAVDYLHFWNRIRHCHFAIDTEKIKPKYYVDKEVIRILHAPNHQGIKGTKYIEKAIEELKNEGYQIEYIYCHGVPNNEFIKIIQSADIVVDQLIMGWYAMFALEAMAAGKPTVCYIREDLKTLYENVGCIESNELPIVSANVSNIKEILRQLIDSRETLGEIGRKSRRFVDKYHSLEAVGEFFREINEFLGVVK